MVHLYMSPYSGEQKATPQTIHTCHSTVELSVDMRLIAHRGFASVYPENTLRAIANAAAIADEIEVDVRRCASGELVVIHDSTVDRVTEKSGAVREYTASELGEMRVFGTDERIPTLRAVLQIVPEHVRVNVELKERDLAADAIELITSQHPHAIISSFSETALLECVTSDVDLPLAYLSDAPSSIAVQTALELECDALHLSVDRCTPDAIAAAHSAGLELNAWTIDTSAEAESLVSIDVDGLIADRPDILPEATL